MAQAKGTEGEVMTARAAARLAWSFWALAMLLVAVGLVFRFEDAARQPIIPANQNVPDWVGPIFLTAQVAFATVGALVASRRPANPIGWLLFGTGLEQCVTDFADAYAVHAMFSQPGSLPGGAAMAWLAQWGMGSTAIGVLALVFLIFPDGRPSSPRWRPAIWLAAAVTAGQSLVAFRPGPLDNYPFVTNPVGIDGALGRLIGRLGTLAFSLLLAALLASAIALVLRFRHSRGEERQQLKWCVSGGAYVVVTFLIAPVIWFTPVLNNTPLWPIMFLLATLALPLSIGIAILKYRLYDIDLIIRRTLVYSVLSSLLVVVYFGSVVLLQTLVRGLTGQAQSQLVIVVSTLGIAALFNPLRHRVQDLIDRAFYRRKYDAAQVLAAFQTGARDEVELGSLVERLQQAVDETVQPEYTSLWLKAAEGDQRLRPAPIQSQTPNQH